jgi:hypothetical protein
MRVLTKSRFKQALACPNKLFYTKKKQYANVQLEDSFLQSLAEGGFQVEELARMYYPGGVLLEGSDWDYQLLAEKTAALLMQENVIIYEAAFLYDNLFIRTDILVKKGNKIELIEVKAKSYSPNDDHTFVGKKGKIVSGWKSYLFDLAFQKHVTQLCLPTANITAKLMLADKTATASVSGMNQLFRITKNKENRTGIEKKITEVSTLGNQVVTTTDVNSLIDEIIDGKHNVLENLSFEKAVAFFKETYENDRYPNWPVSFSACKSCEFKHSEGDEKKGLLSGYKECFEKQLHWKKTDFEKPNLFEIWNFRKGTKLFDQGKYFMEDLNEEDIGLKEAPGSLTSSERQLLQVEKAASNDNSSFVLKEELAEEMASWVFPLNFIDFETSTVALPMFKGMRPYEQIAFQFSHHVLYEDGRIVHQSEYINTTPGEFPNFTFIRALKESLEANEGSIFRFATHENSIVNAIYDQLQASEELDKKELCTFIKKISVSKNNRVETWKGTRNMIDLCDVVKKYYYNPYTKGSNSIKAVLPAMLTTSRFLQQKYSLPLRDIDVKSLNFTEDQIWISMNGTEVINPYKMLPPLFEDWTNDAIENNLSGITSIDNGGQALTAYAKLQYVDMTDPERESLKLALLKYCELDTLAMVMIYEGFRSLLD